LQNIGIVCERGPEWSERLYGTCIKIKCAFWICIFLSPVHVSMTSDSSILYIYSLSVILVSLVSLATTKDDGRKQKYLYFWIWAKTYITKLLKALVVLSNNPEIPWSSNTKWIHINTATTWVWTTTAY
jgi:hypothetical protein